MGSQGGGIIPGTVRGGNEGARSISEAYLVFPSVAAILESLCSLLE